MNEQAADEHLMKLANLQVSGMACQPEFSQFCIHPSSFLLEFIFLQVKSKAKFILEQAMKIQRGKQRYSSTLSLTTALVEGGWSMPHPGHFTPSRETQYSL
jgi:hypothetical protein